MDAPPRPAQEPASTTPSRLPVLVVEDDAPLRALLTYVLREESYPVEEAGDGAAAVHLLHRHRAVSTPLGLILLDLMLPQLSGLDVLHYVARLAAEVPVVIISAHDRLLLSAIAAGASAVLRKPVELEQVLAVMASHCRRAPAGDA
jgi:two-component system, OmpR family, response regulator